MAQLINKVNIFQQDLKTKLPISVLYDQNKTLSILKDFLKTIKQLAKPNTYRLNKLVSSLNQFKLRLQKQFNYDLINFKPLNQQQINRFKSNFSAGCDQLSKQLSTGFYYLNSTLIRNYNVTTKEIIDKVMKLYSNEMDPTLQSLQSNDTISKLMSELEIKLNSLFFNNQIHLIQMVTSDVDLFNEFTRQILMEIVRVNIKGHINESLIKYEIDRTINSLETERANLTQLVKDENTKYSNETSKVIAEYFELKIRNKSMATAFNEALSQIVNKKNLSAIVKLSLIDYKIKQNDETVMLKSIFRYHISHSEIDKPISKQAKQLKFVNIINNEMPKLMKKLETKHNLMETGLMNSFDLFNKDILNGINSTVAEIVKALALIDSTATTAIQETPQLNQENMMFLIQETEQENEDNSDIFQENDYESSFEEFTTDEINNNSVQSTSEYLSNADSVSISIEPFSNKTVFTTQSIPFNEFMELKTSTEKSKPITILEITRPLTYTSTSSEASIALETKPNNLITTLNDDSQLKSELINIYITNNPTSNASTTINEIISEPLTKKEFTTIENTVNLENTSKNINIDDIATTNDDPFSYMPTTPLKPSEAIETEQITNSLADSAGLSTTSIELETKLDDESSNHHQDYSETIDSFIIGI